MHQGACYQYAEYLNLLWMSARCLLSLWQSRAICIKEEHLLRSDKICWAANPSAWSVSHLFLLSTHDQLNLTPAAGVGCRACKVHIFFHGIGLLLPWVDFTPWVKGLNFEILHKLHLTEILVTLKYIAFYPWQTVVDVTWRLPLVRSLLALFMIDLHNSSVNFGRHFCFSLSPLSWNENA